jgi:hypothetical protein
MSKLQKAASTLGTLGTVGGAVAACLVFGEDGRLQQVKLGPLAIFDRRRAEARREARRIRRERHL